MSTIQGARLVDGSGLCCHGISWWQIRKHFNATYCDLTMLTFFCAGWQAELLCSPATLLFSCAVSLFIRTHKFILVTCRICYLKLSFVISLRSVAECINKAKPSYLQAQIINWTSSKKLQSNDFFFLFRRFQVAILKTHSIMLRTLKPRPEKLLGDTRPERWLARRQKRVLMTQGGACW